MQDKVEIDSVLTFLFLKKLMTPITNTKAYELGLINEMGHLIREPETIEEHESVTLLDKTIWKIRRLLGSKLGSLRSFLWLQTHDSNKFYANLVLKGSAEKKASIKRIKRDVERVAESNGCSTEELLYTILQEGYLK